jgi:hypothetical protein
MRTRTGAALAALLSLVLLLSGCQHRAGAAAIVNGDRIDASSVGTYLTGGGENTRAQAAGIVLTTLIQRRLLERTFTRHGGVPGAADLAAVHDDSLPAAVQALGLKAAAADLALRTALEGAGVSASFLDELIAVAELKHIYAERQISSAELTDQPVRVNPQYGTWNAAQLVVDVPGGEPDFRALAPHRQPDQAGAAGVAATS